MAGLLEIRDLEIAYPAGDDRWTPVVHGLSLDVARSEIVGLVGESGSGKTLTALATLGLVPPPGRVRSGSIRLEGRELTKLSGAELRSVRGGEIGLVFQEPAAALTPVSTLGRQLVEAVRAHRQVSAAGAREAAIELLRAVSLPKPERRFDEFPHQLSGGQRQRAILALALAGRPRLLVADEPTASLDVKLQALVLDRIVALRAELGLAVLLISHDLSLVAQRCDRVFVLYAGEVVETGPASRIFGAPCHPYTRALVAAIPRLGERPERGRIQAIDGQVPEPGRRPSGCAFHPRCGERIAACEREAPPWREVGDRHGVRCLRRGQGAEGAS
jgi:peptide/nickel transport system ATP-binding protein